MGTVKRTVFGCPACEARVSGLELACPVCGLAFTTATKFECPFCSALVPRDSASCPSCGIDLRLPEEKRVEATLDEILDQIITTESKNVQANGKRYGCPRCSFLLDGSEDKCPKCAMELTGANKVQCPICGGLIPQSSEKCPECGWVLISLEGMVSGSKTESKPPIEQGPPDKAPVPEIEQEPPEPVEEPIPEAPPAEGVELAECPNCGKESPLDAARCPHCGVEFEPFSELDQPEQPGDVMLDADRVTLVLEGLLKDAKEQEAEEKNGGPIPEELKPVRAATTNIPPARVDATGKIGMVNGTGFVNGRLRRLGAGATNGKGLVNGAGAINGVGAVNGVSMINGRGATNGRTNGRGATNGLGAQGRPKRSFKVTRLIQWRVLVVLIAIMIAVPAVLIIVSVRPSDGISIDGDFDEWADVQSYPVWEESSSAGINVLEWAASFSGNDLYYYIRTESSAMATSMVESFCIYVDSDSLPSTGYSLGTMGAEYRLILEGWDGAIQSTSVSQFGSSGDRLNWSDWASEGLSRAIVRGNEIEGRAYMDDVRSPTPVVILTSKDEAEESCFSLPVPIGGRLLVVEQEPMPAIASSGIVDSGPYIPFLRVTLTAIGGSGTVSTLVPEPVGCGLASSFSSTEVTPGAGVTYDFRVDTSSTSVSQLVSATISEEQVGSDFDTVLVLGTGARAYLGTAPGNVTIDGAFADWEGRKSLDTDIIPVTSESIDIQETGASNSSQDAFFYVSVSGELGCGAYVPETCARPVSGPTGTYVPARKTGEDLVRVYIDTDVSSATGLRVSYLSDTIGADWMIEVRGQFGTVTSSALLEYQGGEWIDSGSPLEAEKDESRMEMGVVLSDLGSPAEIDFIFETTSWNKKSDKALFDPSAASASSTGTRNWAVDTTVSPTTATANSLQRKVFHDGTNFWSFYYDGSNTVYKYSTNGGRSWTSRGQLFTASGIDEVSTWYDSTNNIVYAIGDSTTASLNVHVKRGTVTPGMATISWGSDYTVSVSTVALARKNTFICKADDGYLWLLAQDYVKASPVKHNLAAWKSDSVDSVSAWTLSEETVSVDDSLGTIKGVIVPAGSNGYVWAIYTYEGNMKSKKYDGTWPSQPQDIHSATGTLKANTESSPPSVVVDSRGVVHVVYGDTNESGGVAYTRVCYKTNNTDAETFTSSPTYLDSSKPSGVADISPTISLDTSTGGLFAFWIQTDTSMVGKKVMGKWYSGSSWASIALDAETTYTKQYLTSAYSVSGSASICMLWTQNTTSPIVVMFDKIPEFSEALIPGFLAGFVLVLVVRSRSRGRDRFR